jgi:MoaA/NifB/PqqE/SkfB family radical SAM enzyme
MRSSLEKAILSLRVYARMAVLCLLRRPFKLTLLVAAGCNLRCRICSIWREPSASMTLAEVQRIWRAFPLAPCWINVSGGEPTLDPELESILAWFVDMGRPLLVTLTTNGQIDCAPMIERVLRRNRRALLYVSVSLDGEQREHDLARGRPGSFARAWTTLQHLRSLQAAHPLLRVGVSVTLSDLNRATILPFIRRLIDARLPLTVNLPQSSSYYRNSGEHGFRSLPPEELRVLLRAVERLLPKLSPDSVLKIAFLEMAIGRLQGRDATLPCASISGNVLVTSGLDLADCTLRFEPWRPADLPREAKLEALAETIRRPHERVRTLMRRVRADRCAPGCHTPCEKYVHVISGLLSPTQAPRLIWAYLRGCLLSLGSGRAEVREAAGPSAEPRSLRQAAGGR